MASPCKLTKASRDELIIVIIKITIIGDLVDYGSRVQVHWTIGFVLLF